MVSRRYLMIALSLAASLVLSACDGKKEDPVSKRSSAKVQLPDKPSLTEPKYKRVHGDGVLTVEGLLRERDAHLNREVRVRGKVETLTLCDVVQDESSKKDEQPSGATKKRGSKINKGESEDSEPEPIVSWKCKPQPFALLVDDGGSIRHKLRVGGTMGSRLAQLKEGEIVELNGTFHVVSPNKKYMDQQGVLFLQDVVPPQETQPKG